jgi:hypothetical protein
VNVLLLEGLVVRVLVTVLPEDDELALDVAGAVVVGPLDEVPFPVVPEVVVLGTGSSEALAPPKRPPSKHPGRLAAKATKAIAMPTKRIASGQPAVRKRGAPWAWTSQMTLVG